MSMHAAYAAAQQVGAFRHLIGGRLEDGSNWLDVINPSTGRAFARAPDATREQLECAVAAARLAFTGWSRLSFEERAGYLDRFCDAIQDRLGELAALLTLEQGKPLGAARAEIERAIHIARHLVTIPILPEVLRDDAGGRAELRHKPLGVVAGITPWNVPIVMALPKIAAALYTGNAMILKPSPSTPLTTLRLGDIACRLFPAGVLNILAGGNALGGWITAHPGVDMINFTGSVDTGKRVMAAAAAGMKRLTLELGGNDAAIVLDDVDPKAVAPRLFAAAFANSGQVCQAIKRLYVHDSVYEALAAELASLARKAKVGDGFEDGVEFGPLQNRAQFLRVLELLDDTRAQPGVRMLAGGHALDRPGYFIAPTVVADIREGARLVDEEQFGPVLPLLRFADVEDAVARANDSRYGLGASVWTGDVERGAEIAARLESGVAWVNHHVGTAPAYPFGGVKESGQGRANGEMGLKRHMEPQLIVLPGR